MVRKSSRSTTRTRSAGNTTSLAEAQLADARRRLAAIPARHVAEGARVGACPTCKGDLVESGRLERRFVLPGREIVVTNLTGEKCLRCGEEWLDGPSVATLAPYQDQEVLARYSSKVTLVGGRTLGTYIPKDLAESIRLHKGQTAHFLILDANTLLVRLDRPGAEGKETGS